MAKKLFLVVREDLPPGPQAVQSVHAAIQFVHEHPELELPWYLESNHLALLSVRNEFELRKFLAKAEILGIRTSQFTEPDLGNSLTSAAFEPGQRSKRLLRRLDPALRQM